MEMHMGRQWYSSKFNKLVNVNNIVEAFDGHSLVQLQHKSTKSNTNQMKLLHVLCKNVIKNPNYPLVCLQSGYVHGVHQMRKQLYYECSLIEKYGYIPNGDNTEVKDVIEYFSFPKFSTEQQQWEFRTLDYIHMLTNIRNHVLTHGYTYCEKEHFQHLATHRPDILSCAVVYDKIDIQNAFIAMQMFSAKVEEYF